MLSKFSTCHFIYFCTRASLRASITKNYILIASAELEQEDLQPPTSITQESILPTVMRVSWSQVPGATGYYLSYQRQDLGIPPVVTPQYERIVGANNINVTLSGLEPGIIYRIRVWSTNGASVSSVAMKKDVTTVESCKKHTQCHKI